MNRVERSAENQRRFKAANQRLREVVEENVSSDERVPFLCECVDDTCLGRVDLAVDEFEDLHAGDDVYVILPGHPRIDGEIVLKRHERYEQVQKFAA